MDRGKRLADIAQAAVALEHRIKYPARLLIAQWAVESSWGERQSGEHNYFGITFNPERHQQYRVCRTTEEMTEPQIAELLRHEERITGIRPVLHSKMPMGNGRFRISVDRAFASYGSLDEALADKTSLIMNAPRYRDAFQSYLLSGDVERLISSIAKAGYATAGGYADLLQRVSRQSNVIAAIRRARLEMESI